MAVWIDPTLPIIEVPDGLEKMWFSLGSAKFQLLPSQYQFLKANEEFVGYLAGVGSGKTTIASIKASFLSMHPKNRGLVGMAATTDLDKSAQRDLMDFLHQAGLVAKAPTTKNNTVYVHCVDEQNRNLGYTSEIEFVFLDDPKHVRGRQVGWVWMDEATIIKNGKEAFQNLIGRLRWPAFKDRYITIVTGNPEGHDWVYDFFFNKEVREGLFCNLHSCKFGCRLSDAGRVKCNLAMRRKRRAFHFSTLENTFLPPDYIANMRAGYDDESWEKFVMGSFEAFSGQIFKSWAEDIHVLPDEVAA